MILRTGIFHLFDNSMDYKIILNFKKKLENEGALVNYRSIFIALVPDGSK
jgi:hypothetical protein